MLFKDRKELADKYKEWVKQSIDNNQTMILDCAESVITFLDINGYLNEVVHGEWIKGVCNKCGFGWGKVAPIASVPNYCPNCGANMECKMTREEAIKILSNKDDFGIPKGYTSGYAEANDMAIRSLEAWNNLVKEMEEEIYYYDAFPDIWYGISEAYDIIKKYLKEVEDEQVH